MTRAFFRTERELARTAGAEFERFWRSSERICAGTNAALGNA
jgi:hypothetical protein